jgi:hypothetical protein
MLARCNLIRVCVILILILLFIIMKHFREDKHHKTCIETLKLLNMMIYSYVCCYGKMSSFTVLLKKQDTKHAKCDLYGHRKETGKI